MKRPMDRNRRIYWGFVGGYGLLSVATGVLTAFPETSSWSMRLFLVPVLIGIVANILFDRETREDGESPFSPVSQLLGGLRLLDGDTGDPDADLLRKLVWLSGGAAMVQVLIPMVLWSLGWG